MEPGSDGKVMSCFSASTRDLWLCQLWDLLEKRSLFAAVDAPNATYNENTHLASITALLGSAPNDLLARGRRTSMFYNSSGEVLRWYGRDQSN